MSALKLVIGLWLIVISFFVFLSPTFAAEPLRKDQYDYKTHVDTILQGGVMGKAIGCNIIGIDASDPKALCPGYQDGKLVGYDRFSGAGGALGFVSGTIVALYTNSPISTTYYLANLGENMGIGPKTAYAQVGGSGNAIIQPVLELWKVTRNIAYLFFIIIFLAVGLMIMLRQKINPQTVISVQQALPGLIIGLILVTFSYFIAALLVDTLFVGIQVVTQIFTQPGLQNSLGDRDQLLKMSRDASVFSLFWSAGFNGENIINIFKGVGDQAAKTFSLGITSFIPAVGGGIVGYLASSGSFLGIVGPMALGAGAVPIIVPLLLVVVLLIALFIQMLRLMLALLGTYIQILIGTIAGPLYILAGSIPGRGGVITGWWKGLLANAMVFPAVFAGFLFAGFILGNTAARSWNNTTIPFFGSTSGDFLRILIAYGILLGLPSIPDQVRKAFGVTGPQGFAGAALGGFMAGLGVGRAGVNQGYQRAAGRYVRAQDAYQKYQSEHVDLNPQGQVNVGGNTIRNLITRGWLPRGGR